MNKTIYKNVFNTCVLVSLLGCSNNFVKPSTGSQDKVIFSDKYIGGFPIVYPLQEDPAYQAKVAYPVDGKPAIWVKGDSNYSKVKIKNSLGQVVAKKDLVEPFYTDIINVGESGTYLVEYISDDLESTSLIVKPVANLDEISTPYSIMLFGCFQPFTVVEEGNILQSGIYKGKNGYASKFFKLFTKMALGEDVEKNERNDQGKKTKVTQFPNPSLIIGSGDQVYVDAGYDEVKAISSEHPLSLWQTGVEAPEPFYSGKEYEKKMEDLYRAFGSFRGLNEVYRQIPQINVWDDHEIRDGWGSHGDESNKFQDQFKIARNAFIEHQTPYGKNHPHYSSSLTRFGLDQEFTVGKFSGYALDLRSNRDIRSTHKVLTPEQLNNFREWILKQEGKEVIIVSSMPLFLKNNEFVEKKLPDIKPDLTDDFHDGWSSRYNEDQRDQLLEIIVEARNQGVMPIFVSGDYHSAAMSELWYYKDGDKKEKWKVLGYEILTTGLYHEGMVDGLLAKARFRAESQRVGQHIISNLNVFPDSYSIEPYVKKSMVTENFAGISVDENGDTKISLVLNENSKSMRARVIYLDVNFSRDFKKKDQQKENFITYFLPNTFIVRSPESFTVDYKKI